MCVAQSCQYNILMTLKTSQAANKGRFAAAGSAFLVEILENSNLQLMAACCDSPHFL